MLTLPIKKKWYDMILSKEKTEEYREINQYYTTRFRNLFGYPVYWNEPHEICFRNGYRKDSPSFVATCTLRIGKGKQVWGAKESKKYYVLKIWEVKT